MKRCPSCGTQYTDDSLRYCLQDGSPLEDDLGPVSNAGETETVISSRARDAEGEPTRVSVPPPAARPPARGGRTALIVAATILLTVIVAGAGGLAVWLFTRGSATPDTARVNNSKPENSSISATPRPSPSATPSPSPSVTPTPNIDRTKITKAVSDEIDSWKENTENFDGPSLMDSYADRVDYFRTGVVSKQQVRDDKERAFSKFDTIRFDLSNMKVDVDPSGETATAEFDKAWDFEGESNSKGKVRSQLKFRRSGDRWLITSEKDLKVY